jgi:UDP-2,3-diacylglucosamine pyrophosphatase LpxH
LQNRIKVHWLAGNHDYHLLKLKNRAPHYDYPFEFKETLELRDGRYTYRFIHGFEFEYGNELNFIRPLMEILCHIMSDSEGVAEDELWVQLARKLSDLQYSVLTHRLQKDDLNTRVRSLKDGPEVRLQDKLDDIEKRSFEEVKEDMILIYGHTHHPFINDKENLVNSGSWVKEADPHNTYVEISNGRPRLFVYGGEEIKERQTIDRTSSSQDQ